jgi:hypothetical protein
VEGAFVGCVPEPEGAAALRALQLWQCPAFGRKHQARPGSPGEIDLGSSACVWRAHVNTAWHAQLSVTTGT